jgi:Pyridoxamine 5'-phosphate oxidase
MSRFVADQLTGPLMERLSLDRALSFANRAIVICTIDEHGWPHPAMLSSLEIVARDVRNVRLATDVSSRTTRNLKTNRRLSLILADEDAVYYLKGDVLLLAETMQAAPRQAKFNLCIDSVLQDFAQEYEDARILTGIRIQRAQLDESQGRARLAELLAD